MNYKNVISEMKNIFGNHAEISIEFVDKIPVLASGNGYFGEADPPDSELKLVVCSYQLG